MLPESEPSRPQGFLPEALDESVLSNPLARWLQRERVDRMKDTRFAVVLTLNGEFSQGLKAVQDLAISIVENAIAAHGAIDAEGVDREKSSFTDRYLFAKLRQVVIREVVVLNQEVRATHGEFA